MPKRAREMSALAVSRLRTPGFFAVGGVPGLALQVTTPTSRSWVLRVTVAGRRREYGLGSFESVGLAAAREAARQLHAQIALGLDPKAEQRKAAAEVRAARAKEKTFRAAAEEFIRAKSPEWSNAKHAQQWTNTLERYAFPIIGQVPVQLVEVGHLQKILSPIWLTRTETASRIRGRIEQVLDWAAVQGLRDPNIPNPARWDGHLDKLFAAPRKVAVVEHHPAMPIDKMPDFVRRLAETDGMGARALEFTIFTGMRSGAVRGALWPEFDLDDGTWTVPASRMKGPKGARSPHVVPLPSFVVEWLKRLPRLGFSEVVFFGAKGSPISDMTMTLVMRRMGLSEVPHGFRSTFRDWAAERTHHPAEVAEMALAHKIANKVEAAYRRGDLLIKRRALMLDWVTFCTTGLMASGSPAGHLST